MSHAGALDPLSLSINTGVGHVLYLSRQYDRAIEQYRNTIKLDPNFIQARLWFGRPYRQKRMYKQAIAELDQAVALSGGGTISLAMLGHANGAAGNKEEARKTLEKLMDRSKKQYVPSLLDRHDPHRPRRQRPGLHMARESLPRTIQLARLGQS